MTQTTNNGDSQAILKASIAATLVLALAVPSYAAALPASVVGKASDALVTLARQAIQTPYMPSLEAQ